MPFGFHLTMDTLPSEEQLHSPASEALPPLLDIALLIRVPEGLQPSRTTRCSAHTTPAADCCHRVKNDFSLLRLEFETGSRSPEVSSTAFNAQPLDLHSVPLIDMGFAIIGPLARRSRLRSGSCSSAHVFAPRFLQTPPHGEALALHFHFASIRL